MTKAVLKDQAESEDFPPIIDIIEVNDTRISHFVQLKGEVRRLSDSGLMAVEGEQQIERLLQSQRKLRSMLLEPSLYERFRPFLQGSDYRECELFRAPREPVALANIYGRSDEK